MDDKEQSRQVLRYVPPFGLFRDGGRSMPANGVRPGQLITPTVSVEFPESGGILSHREGDLHPSKGWPFREAVWALDTVKRAIMGAARLMISHPFRITAAAGAAAFVLMPRGWQRKAADAAAERFTDYTELVFRQWGMNLEYDGPDGPFCLESVVLQERYFCEAAREVRRALMAMAGESLPYQRLATFAAMLLEFDDAYRYMAQDASEMIDMGSLRRNPGRELSRVLGVMESRGAGTAEKFASFGKLVPWLMRIGIFRDAAIRFFGEIDLSKLRLDDADLYRCLLWGGYRFRGIPDDQRLSMRLMIDTAWASQTKQKTA